MSKFLKLFSDCIPVKGYTKSTICDLTRGDIINIPNSMYDFLFKYEGKNIDYILNQFTSKEEKAIISDYIKALEEKEIIFWCDEKELKSFPKISMKWEYPKKIINAVIEYNEKFIDHSFFKKLDTFGVEHYQFRLSISTTEELNKFHDFIIIFLEENNNLKTVELIFTQYNSTIKNFIQKKSTLYINFIREILFYDSPYDRTSIVNEIYFKYKKSKVTDSYKVSSIKPDSFICNIDFFTESVSHNIYYNKKISIDYNGNVKNCLKLEDKYGSINEIDDIVKNKKIESLWNVSKDKIEFCKDCEYRFVCFDDRPIKYNPEKSIYFSDIKCNYDPIIGKWSK